jgi:hypothetical protein
MRLPSGLRNNAASGLRSSAASGLGHNAAPGLSSNGVPGLGSSSAVSGLSAMGSKVQGTAEKQCR